MKNGDLIFVVNDKDGIGEYFTLYDSALEGLYNEYILYKENSILGKILEFNIYSFDKKREEWHVSNYYKKPLTSIDLKHDIKHFLVLHEEINSDAGYVLFLLKDLKKERVREFRCFFEHCIDESEYWICCALRKEPVYIYTKYPDDIF
jgi:hypothetical protein